MIHQKELNSSMLALMRGKQKPNKYHAKSKFSENGYRFDSKREYDRYQQLVLLEKSGHIRNLGVHPLYPIKWPTSGDKICIVELDFEYSDLQGAVHHEDVKGADTALSRIKRKLVEAAYHFKVELIK